ncbi:MAG: site-2 protease family protein [Defluviitaleaceae bacterium]|nr:site-2 protease family protein [Defluviitaleaceae bacterium]
MEFMFILPGALLAPVIHEFTKAVTSTVQGDPTPRSRGFLTFNIIKYVEPLGFIIMVLLGGFGWGQPVPTASLHYKNRRRATVITYVTPMLVNLLLGIGAIIALSLWVGVPLNAFLFVRREFILAFEWDMMLILKLALYGFAQCSILLALFNLIPVHPLAMSKIIQPFAKPDTLVKLNHYEKTMQFVLVFMLAFGFIGRVLGPVWIHILGAVWLY